MLARFPHGPGIRANDGACDPTGRLWVGTMAVDESPGAGALYRLDAGELTTILEVEIPKVRVPLNPGKNITVIAEVIALNHLLKYSGIDPATRFNERLKTQMRAASDVRKYLQEDNE